MSCWRLTRRSTSGAATLTGRGMGLWDSPTVSKYCGRGNRFCSEELRPLYFYSVVDLRMCDERHFKLRRPGACPSSPDTGPPAKRSFGERCSFGPLERVSVNPLSL